MGREIKRVPLDFDAPLERVWSGYLDTDDADDWTPTEPPTGEGWQVWETVSEGSPITPVFPTADALVDYLATKGTVWDQEWHGSHPPKGPWRREAAEAFVRSGYAPSFVLSGNVLFDGARDADGIEAIR